MVKLEHVLGPVKAPKPAEMECGAHAPNRPRKKFVGTNETIIAMASSMRTVVDVPTV